MDQRLSCVLIWSFHIVNSRKCRLTPAAFNIMSGIFDLIKQQIGGNNLSQISRSLGVDEKTTGNAINSAIPALLGALSRNANQGQGAQSILNALKKDHDGSILDNLSGFLQSQGGNQPINGQAILNHLLGQKQSRVQQGVSQVSGLDANSTQKLLSMLAPIVMGAVGKQTRQNGLDSQGLMGLLSNEAQQVQKSPTGNLVGKMLDQDGDGDFDASDAIGLLGKFFKK